MPARSLVDRVGSRALGVFELAGAIATFGAHAVIEAVPEVAAEKLLAQANDAGGRDNITLVIVRFDQGDSEAGFQ